MTPSKLKMSVYLKPQSKAAFPYWPPLARFIQAKPPLLEVKNLTVSSNDKIILKGFSLVIFEGETHVLIGPNGSGKSTLSKVLVGHPSYHVFEGSILYQGKDLFRMSPEQRAHSGIFLAFQHPVEFPGLTLYEFLLSAYNEKQRALKKQAIDPVAFMKILFPLLEILQISPDALNRSFNEAFSGGEKKKNEILQLFLLKAKLILLDEIDSGLDLDAVKLIYQKIQENRGLDSGLLVITHNPKIFDYLSPTHVHLFMEGKIQRTGGTEILKILEDVGYENILKSYAVPKEPLFLFPDNPLDLSNDSF
jgi:Fe-S cluster assembly ATP-binding protein